MESTSAVAFSLGGRGSHAGGFHGVGACDDMAWVVENGNVLGLGDDFLVDDLLDFGQLETDTEAEGEDDDDDDTKEEEEEEHRNRNKKYHQIQQQKQEEEEAAAAKQGKEETLGEDSSAVSFEPLPPPVSELTLPAHDAAELEWVSRIMDDSLSEFPTYPVPKLDTHTHKRTQPFLPPQPMPMATIPVKAKRSKRTRTHSWSSSCSSSSSWGSGVPLLFIDSSSAPSSTTTSSTSSSCSSSSSYSSSKQQQQQQQSIFGHQLFDGLPVSVFPHHPPPNGSKSKSLSLKKQMPKKRGRKPKSLLLREGAGNSSMSGGHGGGGERRCSHCGVNKTPQWRTGPDGAKTLCNACGVRYKSGRLLPEYRPACSPTFVSHVHSNSHRKVMEMRRKKDEEESKENNKLLLISSALPVASF